MRTLNLEGLIPATLTPFTDTYAVDEPALRKYIRWLLGFQGLKGVAVNMDTGEGPHLTREEKRRILSEGGYASPEHPLEGVNRLFRLTAEMQKAFPHIPVAGSGYSWLRQFLLNAAAANVSAESVSIVGVGRTAIAYPDFAIDGRERGELNAQKVCLADSMCSNMLRAWDKEKHEKVPAGCPVRDSRYKKIYSSLLK